MRNDGRTPDQARPVQIETNYLPAAEGSALISTGNTKVICTASVEDSVPGFLRGSGKGWVTAEYAMLPRATNTRTNREVSRGRPSGRTSEIQRLIGRSLRAALDLRDLGERSIFLDCDVLQADGGTRTASITGAWVALALAIKKMVEFEMLAKAPELTQIVATSVGVIDGTPMLDLCYEEDSRAGVDMNVVMTGEGEFVEVQATAEGKPFPREHFDELLGLSESGIKVLAAAQREAVGG